ncbi:unnamed protein product [Blepharisma stoltei]|uniref:Uncharacterized protein n=1 Tax=Blepharisma stoltei TaxID=1481888 RepID=A0AAU9J205_9CILI|nr:unnamed protein product [Blepharisma stoltei]
MDEILSLSREGLIDRCQNQEKEIKSLKRKLQEKEYKIETLKFKLRRTAFKDPSILMKEARKLRSEVTENYGSSENEFWNAPLSGSSMNKSKLEDFESFKHLFLFSPSPANKITLKSKIPNERTERKENYVQKRYKSTMARYQKNPLPAITKRTKK